MNTPTILIYKAIAPRDPERFTDTVCADDVAAQLAYIEQSGATDCIVAINSNGGNWLESQAIVAVLRNSSLNVTTRVDGLAASAAALITMAGKRIQMAAHARLMIHNCGGIAVGGIDAMEREIASQRAINASMATLIAARTKLSEDEVAALLQAETWFTPTEAKAQGLIDDILEDAKPAPPATADATALLAFYTAQLSTAATAATTAQKMLTQKDVDDAVAAATGPLVIENTTLKQRLAAVETEQATSLVEAAISAGKLTASARDTTIALATGNYAATKAMIDAIPAPAAPVANTTASAGVPRVAVAAALQAIANQSGAGVVPAGRENWSLRQWEKEDERGLTALKASNPAHYAAMFEKQYGRPLTA